MTHDPPSPAASALASPQEPVTDFERRLASGGSLHLRTRANGEELELRSAKGDLELHIVLTAAGPVVSLRCARLEVESPEVAFRCDTFDVEAKRDVRLASEREVTITADELRAKTERDIHLNGAYVRINCDPDLQVPVPMPDVAALLASMNQGHVHGPGCGHDHADEAAAAPALPSAAGRTEP
jgi:hypothetical protein